MREFKFRAWDNVKFEMYYLGEEDDVSFSVESIGKFTAYGLTEHDWGFKKLEHLKYMQYTGLKDKNGKEIYEGDIVKVKYSYEQNYLGGFAHDELIGHVKFHHGCFDVYKNNVDQGIVIREHISDLETEWEIIGNIFEHPHLLEESK